MLKLNLIYSILLNFCHVNCYKHENPNMKIKFCAWSQSHSEKFGAVHIVSAGHNLHFTIEARYQQVLNALMMDFKAKQRQASWFNFKQAQLCTSCPHSHATHPKSIWSEIAPGEGNHTPFFGDGAFSEKSFWIWIEWLGHWRKPVKLPCATNQISLPAQTKMCVCNTEILWHFCKESTPLYIFSQFRDIYFGILLHIFTHCIWNSIISKWHTLLFIAKQKAWHWAMVLVFVCLQIIFILGVWVSDIFCHFPELTNGCWNVSIRSMQQKLLTQFNIGHKRSHVCARVSLYLRIWCSNIWWVLRFVDLSPRWLYPRNLSLLLLSQSPYLNTNDLFHG